MDFFFFFPELPTKQATLRELQLWIEIIQEINDLLATEQDDKKIVRSALDLICKKMSWCFSSHWTLDKQSMLLYMETHWKLSEETEEFKKYATQIRLKIGEGLPGRIWESKSVHIIDDINADKNFPHAAIAKLVNFRSAVGFPLIIENEVHGVFEFFSTKKIDISQDCLNVLKGIGIIIGQVVRIQNVRSNITHEINNPLAIVDGKVKNLIKKIENNKLDFQKTKEELEKIAKSAERINKIVKSLRC